MAPNLSRESGAKSEQAAHRDMQIFGILELQQLVQHFSFESKLSRNRLYRKLVRHNAKSIENIKEITIPMVHTIYHG
ncbi:hypothetical protein H5410_047635 [Solanum commersonii]|uniref:Uncharacterized protein n=1 Tax=Solanum commersonii TaxID=4109 RepID=A0A9J5XFP6_SOLCO|nr:hypothetical protein H5410_047635 [Solanum commersonii]